MLHDVFYRKSHSVRVSNESVHDALTCVTLNQSNVITTNWKGEATVMDFSKDPKKPDMQTNQL